MVLVHSCNPEALRGVGPTTLLVSPWLQAVVMSSSPRATCAAQAHRYGLQPSQALLPTRVALLSLLQLQAASLFSTPRDQQRTHPAPQAARYCKPQPRLWGQLGPSALKGGCLAGDKQCRASKGRSAGQGRRRPGAAACKHTAMRGAVPGDMQSLEQATAPRGLR